MSLPEQLADLSVPSAYAHPCRDLEVVETHISWVILTGELAYKVKKPVKFSFVDFSSLDRREHFCREELRCNRRFAPSLYLDVVPIARAPDGRLRVGGAGEQGEVVEWAVKMRQFPPEAQLDRMLARDAVSLIMMNRFGHTLAAQHAALPTMVCGAGELEDRVLAPVWENFDDVAHLPWVDGEQAALLNRGRAAMERHVARHRGLLERRLVSGWIRECHGDLHLSNMVALEQGVTAFDCLEFSPDLRWIDPVSDVAFLFMDCLVRGRADLAYGFLDGYLDESGDYEGAVLLTIYASYRSMVRAKVAALRREQAEPTHAASLERRFAGHVAWATEWLERPPGRLVLMCGLSGSGKSYLAERLAPRLPAVRLRSDVARKTQAGLNPRDPAGAAVDKGLYDAASTQAVYDWLAVLAEDLLRSGEHVIVDATFLDARRRRPFLALAAGLGGEGVVVHCDAPVGVLEDRLRSRAAAGGDPSDADLAVLQHQMQTFRPPRRGMLRVDTGSPFDDTTLEALARRVLG